MGHYFGLSARCGLGYPFEKPLKTAYCCNVLCCVAKEITLRVKAFRTPLFSSHTLDSLLLFFLHLFLHSPLWPPSPSLPIRSLFSATPHFMSPKALLPLLSTSCLLILSSYRCLPLLPPGKLLILLLVSLLNTFPYAMLLYFPSPI